jgi:hypothetical protein
MFLAMISCQRLLLPTDYLAIFELNFPLDYFLVTLWHRSRFVKLFKPLDLKIINHQASNHKFFIYHLHSH